MGTAWLKKTLKPVQFKEDESWGDQVKGSNIGTRIEEGFKVWEHPKSSIEQAKHTLGLGDPDPIQAPPLSEQEQAIIARMKELAMGNPELGEVYANFTKNAIEGKEGVTPGIQRDIAEQEAITKEQIARGLGSKGAYMSTAGVKKMGRFNEQANMKREMARQEAIRRGEGLLASRAARMTGAAGTALGPMAQERGMGFAAEMQNAANIAGQRAGQMELAGQVGSAYLTSRRK